jgi:ABC-type uncharacterized transport system permease subunit
MSDPRTLIEKYTVLGTIAGGTGNLAQALVFGHPTLLTTTIGALAGAATGAIYGYLKLRAAARRRR